MWKSKGSGAICEQPPSTSEMNGVLQDLESTITV